MGVTRVTFDPVSEALYKKREDLSAVDAKIKRIKKAITVPNTTICELARNAELILTTPAAVIKAKGDLKKTLVIGTALLVGAVVLAALHIMPPLGIGLLVGLVSVTVIFAVAHSALKLANLPNDEKLKERVMDELNDHVEFSLAGSDITVAVERIKDALKRKDAKAIRKVQSNAWEIIKKYTYAYEMHKGQIATNSDGTLKANENEFNLEALRIDRAKLEEDIFNLKRIIERA